MYLSRLWLNPRSRPVQRDMADMQQMHRTIMSAFPQAQGSARAQFGVLYRLESYPRSGATALLVQSLHQPAWEALPQSYLGIPPVGQQNPACKSLERFAASLASGMALRFRLRANPTKKEAGNVKGTADGAHRNRRRFDLRNEDDQRAWLQNKGKAYGFQVLQVRITDMSPLVGHRGRQEDARQLTIAPVQYDGVLSVTDSTLFQGALTRGIGPAKAYGCGLLSVAPVAQEGPR